MTLKIISAALNHIKKFEGLRLKAYRDISGILTIGYGHTAKIGSPVPDEGMIITEQQAEIILRQDLIKMKRIISSFVKVPLNENQFIVLISFCFNVGAANFIKSTLLKKLNNKAYMDIPFELSKWVYTTKNNRKVFSSGLSNRRAIEAKLWIK